MKIESRYLDSSYLAENPNWDRQDAPWKAAKVHAILSDHQINPVSICEVGCGSGDILVHLAQLFPDAALVGYDISPQAAEFWKEHQSVTGEREKIIEFHLGDFHAINKQKFDVLLMLDVFEHVRDPYTFLEMSQNHAEYFIFHVPLDLSANSVARGKPLIDTQKKVGHLHFYTKDLALATLRRAGFKVVDWQYTGASLNMPNRSFKTRLACFPRRVVFFINKDWGVRLLGGETLVVLATAYA